MSPLVLDDLEIMPPGVPSSSDVLDFDVQSLIISLQASRPLQVGARAVILALHSLLLTLDDSYAHQAPPSSQPGLGPPAILHTGGAGHGDLGT